MALMSPAYNTIKNSKRSKVKINKARMKELTVEWHAYNKRMKRQHLHHMRYNTLEEYIAYVFGLNKKPNPASREYFKPNRPVRNVLAEQDAEHRKKYPSLMEMQMKEGTFNSSSDGKGTKKESMKYTGDLIEGIATMHKSNAVPVMKGTSQATDIARMRR